MIVNKVEICGVNTAKLKILKESEKMALLKEIKNGNKEAREKLINGNLRLVLSVIQRFTNRGEKLDDLFQIGCIGLIKSIDNFDVTQNVRFSTYAVPMIIGEIRRYLRDNNSIRVSRSLKDIAYKAMQIKEDLINKTQKEPRIEEIANKLNIKKEIVVLALEAIVDPLSLYEPVYSDGGDMIYVMDQVRIEEIANKLNIKKEIVVLALEAIVDPLSLYEPVYSDGGDMIYVMDQVGDKNDDNNWLDEIVLKQSIENLNDREKKIL